MIDKIDEESRDFDLNMLSYRVCNNCTHWRTDACTDTGDRSAKYYWTSLSSCKDFKPTELGEYALEIQTMRKLKENL